MRQSYQRKAWYLDEDILLEGYTDKRGFHPNSFAGGFSLSLIRKQMIGKIIFYDLDEAKQKLGDIEVVS